MGMRNKKLHYINIHKSFETTCTMLCIVAAIVVDFPVPGGPCTSNIFGIVYSSLTALQIEDTAALCDLL